MTTVEDAARAWHQAGYCILPAAADGTKKPGIGSWDRFKSELPSAEQVRKWLTTAQGIGMVCGAVSGNVEMLELEGAAADLFLPFVSAVAEADTGLANELGRYVEKTPGGGYHFLYRVDGPVAGNTKLASRPRQPDDASPSHRQTLIETRGEGGWTVLAPSGGTTHPTGKAWHILAGEPGVIGKLTEAQRDLLHAIAASFDEMPPPEPVGAQPGGGAVNLPAGASAEGTPGADFNSRASWEEILQPAGWRKVYARDGKIYWQRPGKTDRTNSATTGYQGDWLYVFSTSTEFETERTYTKFGAYCVVPETRVLRADLTWARAGDLHKGDALVGLDEYPISEDGKKVGRRKLRLSHVEGVERKVLHCWKITLADGRSVTSSWDHPWLAVSSPRDAERRRGYNRRWVKTHDLRPGMRLCSLTPATWETETDFDSGWLSGLFDGEGWFSRGRVGLSQKPGPVMDRAELLLKERGFTPIREAMADHPGKNADNLVINDLPSIFRLLGTLQPGRLVAKVDKWIGRGAWTTTPPDCTIVSVEYAGQLETAAFTTTTRTFIAEGLISHNTLLNHSGDYSAAASDLRKRGYGSVRPTPVERKLTLVRPPTEENSSVGATALAPEPVTVSASFTDRGNAELMVAATQAKGEMLYSPKYRAFYTWRGNRWLLESPDDITPAVQLFNEVIDALAVQGQDADAIAKHKMKSMAWHSARDAIQFFKATPEIQVSPDDMDNQPLELNTPSGVVNLLTGQFHPSTPADRHTRLAGVSPDFHEVPRQWLAFLHETFGGDAAMIGYIQRLAGYSMTGAVTHEVMPFLYGSGANGKSVLLVVLAEILGDYASSAPPDFLLARTTPAHETEIARLHGQRFVICSEVPHNARFNEGRMKSLCSQEKITGHFMGKDHITFRPSHHLWLAGNHEPAIPGGGNGFWRRFRKIPFHHTVPAERQDTELAAKLVATEGPAIMAWMIEGAKAQAHGLADPPEVLLATEEYASAEDQLGRFLTECVVMIQGRREETKKVSDAYNRWLMVNNERPAFPGPRLGRELKLRGFVRQDSSGKAYYRDVVLLNPEGQPDGPTQDEIRWGQ